VGRCGTTTCTLGLFHYICLVWVGYSSASETVM
jgi:hypothetical protein